MFNERRGFRTRTFVPFDSLYLSRSNLLRKHIVYVTESILNVSLVLSNSATDLESGTV